MSYRLIYFLNNNQVADGETMDDFVMQLDVNRVFDSYWNSHVNKVKAVSTHPKHTQGVVLLDGNVVIKPFTYRLG
mgnify:CR=1 FL=1